MKQTYIKPMTMTHQMQVSHSILQASRSVGVSKDSYDSSTGTILSRRGNSDWDDEE